MSDGGWGEPGWGEDGRRREELPKVEDLPISEQGYDREAVRDAFDSFYRHTAQLDATLRILEGVELFGRQARELRADIRSLRAASWGPAPSARHVWSVGHEVWSPQEPPAAFAASLPRLAVWAALIVAVGVGAALAELSTVLIVLLVVAAWALVALIEVALAGRRAAGVPVQLAPDERAGAVPVLEPAAEPAAAAAQETMIVPAGEAAVARQEEAAAPEPEDIAEPVAAEPVDVAEPVVAERELEPAVTAEPAEPAEPEHEADVPGEPAEPEAAEPHPVAGAADDGPAPALASPRRRFWQRRPAEPVSEDTDAVPAPVVEPATWRSEERVGDPWEDEPVSEDTGEPLVTAPPPSRGLLRRGRR